MAIGGSNSGCDWKPTPSEGSTARNRGGPPCSSRSSPPESTTSASTPRCSPPAARPEATGRSLGAGSGYFALRLADAAGPSGAIYALEVDRAALARLRERAARQGRTNAVAIEGASDDPRLPDASGDLALIVGSYAAAPAPVEAIENQLRAAGFALAERRPLLTFTPSR